MHLPLHVWLISGAIAVLLIAIVILVATIKHRILMSHLSMFAEDIHAVGRDTLKKEPIHCTFCRSRSRVHLWQYGKDERTYEVLLCASCASHVVKFLELPAILKGNQSPYTQQRRHSVFHS